MGTVEFKDAMILDGLWDVCTAAHGDVRRGLRRAVQDQPRRPVRAGVDPAGHSFQKEGLFKAEIVPCRSPRRRAIRSWSPETRDPRQPGR